MVFKKWILTEVAKEKGRFILKIFLSRIFSLLSKVTPRSLKVSSNSTLIVYYLQFYQELLFLLVV